MSAPTTTEVADRDDRGASAVGLAELVALVIAALGSVPWRVFELEAIGHGTVHLAALGERIEREATGLALSTDELSEIAADLEQVINAVLVVPGDQEPPTPPPIDAAFYSRCRVVLECVDGDVWRITTADKRVHDRLRKNFRDAVTNV